MMLLITYENKQVIYDTPGIPSLPLFGMPYLLSHSNLDKFIFN